MNNIVTQRFIKCHNKLREDRRIKSSRQFAVSLDYLPQSLSEILKSRRDVTIELIRKAAQLYKINPMFLFTGEGPMFLSEEENRHLRVLTVVTDPRNDERIVHVPVPAQAGYANGFDDPVFMRELPVFTLPDYRFKTGTHRSFDVSGDSMEPTVFEGDKLICSYVEPSQWEHSIKDNFVYVVVTAGDVLVKRVQNQLSTQKSLILISDNQFYEPYKVHLSELKEVWSVRSRISPFLPKPQHHLDSLRDEMSRMQQAMEQQSKLIETLTQTIAAMSKG